MKRTQSSPAAQVEHGLPWSRERWLVAGLVLLAALIQVPFFLGPYFGEQDAARLANDALIWKEVGLRVESLSEYRYFVSPGYIVLLLLLDALAGLTGLSLAWLMNALNAVIFVVIVIPIYLLFRRLAGQEAALLGTLVLLFVPTFWMSGLYGFPHLPALLSLVLAAHLYDRWLLGEGDAPWERGPWPLLAVGALLTACVLLKGDLYLAAAALFVLHLWRRGFALRGLATPALVLAVPVVVSALTSAALLQQEGTVVGYMAEYERRYPIWRRAFITPAWYLGVLERLRFSTGAVTVPLFAGGAAVLLWRRRPWPVLFLLAWIMPVLLFWTLRPGDSARHHLPIAVALALGVGVLLAAFPFRRLVKVGMAVLVIGVNYYAHDPSTSTLWPGGRLFENAGLVKERLATYHELSEQFAEVPSAQKALLGGGMLPFTINEVLRHADRVTSVALTEVAGDIVGLTVEHEAGGMAGRTSFVGVSPDRLGEVAAAIGGLGYDVYVWEYDPEGEHGVLLDFGRATSYRPYPNRLFRLTEER